MKSPIAFVLVAALAVSWPAWAAVTISSATTQNMSCSDGFCVPTASDAVLNVGDLENLLASGNVEVTTTGSGVQANNVEIDAPLSWSSTNLLGLDANRSIIIGQPISVRDQGGLALTTDDGGKGGLLLFLDKGDVTFANLSSSLSINGEIYALESTLPDLANAIAANAAGAYALANSYDASRDGTYANAPIATVFTGSFNGLGNQISNLKINDKVLFDGVADALFSEIGTGGAVASIGVVNANITADDNDVAGIAGINEGTVVNAFASGKFKVNANDSNFEVGGLIDWNYGGTVILAHADVEVSVVSDTNGAGGLVGDSSGSIIESYATGLVAAGDLGAAGGLVSSNTGSIEDSYAAVSVTGKEGTAVGGLIGANTGTTAGTYSVGAVKDHLDRDHLGYRGGFVGEDGAPGGSMAYAYWDTTTAVQRRGAGTPKNDPGITGLTTEQLQSGLPKGFDPKVWAENPKINNDLPYLIDNPPRE